MLSCELPDSQPCDVTPLPWQAPKVPQMDHYRCDVRPGRLELAAPAGSDSVHWNLDSQVDGYGDKFVGLLLMPIVGGGPLSHESALVFHQSRRTESRHPANCPRGFPHLHFVRDCRDLLPFRGGRVRASRQLDRRHDYSRMLRHGNPVRNVLGNFMGKIRPNWFVGVRTPWTLASKYFLEPDTSPGRLDVDVDGPGDGWLRACPHHLGVNCRIRILLVLRCLGGRSTRTKRTAATPTEIQPRTSAPGGE